MVRVAMNTSNFLGQTGLCKLSIAQSRMCCIALFSASENPSVQKVPTPQASALRLKKHFSKMCSLHPLDAEHKGFGHSPTSCTACYNTPSLVFPLLLILQIQLVRMACPLSNILLLTSEYTCAILITALPISLLSKGVIECRCRIGELIPRYLKVQKKNLWKRALQMPPCGKYAKKPA